MLGAYAARVAPFNVNYRYVAEELRYLLTDSAGPGHRLPLDLRPGAGRGARRPPRPPAVAPGARRLGARSPPGRASGTRTRSPRSMPAPPTAASRRPTTSTCSTPAAPRACPRACCGVRATSSRPPSAAASSATGEEWPDLEAIVDNARNGGSRVLPAAPFMHGAAHWLAINALGQGNTVVLPDRHDRLRPGRRVATVRAGVGRHHADRGRRLRPSAARRARPATTTTSRRWCLLISGGAALSAPVKAGLLDRIPGMALMDGLGASESGTQASQITGAGAPVSTGTFTPSARHGDRVRGPHPPPRAGQPRSWVGWPSSGRVPLGYLGDEAKTARTFPVIDGVRYSVPGDRARVTADGLLELHGRDSVTINSGGEKIFAEEVEAALAHHPGGLRRRRHRTTVGPLGPGGRGRRSAPGRARRDAPTSCWPSASATSPATSCRRRSSSSTTSCARPPARPTTAGLAPPRRARRRTAGG